MELLVGLAPSLQQGDFNREGVACLLIDGLHICFVVCLSFHLGFLTFVVFLDFLVLKKVCVDCCLWQSSFVLSVFE